MARRVNIMLDDDSGRVIKRLPRGTRSRAQAAAGFRLENPRCISVREVRSHILRRDLPCRGAWPRGCVCHGGRTICASRLGGRRRLVPAALASRMERAER